MKKISFIIESIAGMVLLWLVNLIFFRQNPGFLGVSAHPYLYLQVLITIRYGYTRGIFSLVLATGSYLICLAAGNNQFSAVNLSPVATFIIFTTIVGLVADNYRNKLKKAEEHISSLAKVSRQLQDEKEQFEHKNSELSRRLMAEKSTFSILYRAARKLSTLDPDKLMEGIIDLVDDVIDGDNCAVFLLEGHRLVLKAAKNRQALDEQTMDQEILQQVLKEKKTFSIKDKLLKDRQALAGVFICGPLLNGSEGDAAGIILVQGLDFLKYNPTTVRVFTLVCDWASICYDNARLYSTRKGAGDIGQLVSSAGSGFNGIFEYGTQSSKIMEFVDRVWQNL